MRPDVLAETLAATLRGLLDPMGLRVAALEDLQTKDGIRLEGYTAALQRDLAAAVERIAALEARGPEPGPEGPPGPAGPAGQDGAPGMDYKGAYVRGKQYEKGDCVTAGGSLFFCHRLTESSPGASSDWTLIVKHGRDLRASGGDRG